MRFLILLASSTFIVPSLLLACGAPPSTAPHDAGAPSSIVPRDAAAPPPPAPPDAAVAGPCTATLETYCAHNHCPPASWPSVQDAGKLWCEGSYPNTVFVATVPCNGYLVAKVGDGYVDFTYVYDASSGSLEAIEVWSDTTGGPSCVAGSPGFISPAACSGGEQELCDHGRLFFDAGIVDSGHD